MFGNQVEKERKKEQLAYLCKKGGECVGCGECEAESEAECICPICLEECSVIYSSIFYGILGCELCVSVEDASDVLKSREVEVYKKNEEKP